MNRNTSHNHGIDYYAAQQYIAGNAGLGAQYTGYAAGSLNYTSIRNTDINHEHGIVAQGGGQAFDILPKYKSVYIWERVA
jgi:hypothetical protein